MILFINPLLPEIILSLLSDKTLLESQMIAKGDDFSHFPDTLIELINAHEIDEIWMIVGPGSFTRMRIVSLTLSTLILSRGIRVKGCHFFELIDHATGIIRANEREYIVAQKDQSRSLISKEMIPSGIYCGYGEKNDFTDDKVFIEYREDWAEVIKIFFSLKYLDRVTPIYLKEPHITWSKKNTSPSGGIMSR